MWKTIVIVSRHYLVLFSIVLFYSIVDILFLLLFFILHISIYIIEQEKIYTVCKGVHCLSGWLRHILYTLHNV